MSDPNNHIRWNQHTFELLRCKEFNIKGEINLFICTVMGAAGSLTKVTVENKFKYGDIEVKFFWNNIVNEKRNRVFTIKSGQTEHIEVSSLYQTTVLWRIV